jgi:hypothetical protein
MGLNPVTVFSLGVEDGVEDVHTRHNQENSS